MVAGLRLAARGGAATTTTGAAALAACVAAADAGEYGPEDCNDNEATNDYGDNGRPPELAALVRELREREREGGVEGNILAIGTGHASIPAGEGLPDTSTLENTLSPERGEPERIHDSNGSERLEEVETKISYRQTGIADVKM
ncbi:hypothetical protein GX48_05371 [Paracoccidioides brasiliensis]|nr:hypothetical protein GX48_05371 [Paracoccidioides brasiliensis]